MRGQVRPEPGFGFAGAGEGYARAVLDSGLGR
jgi:hypothetical protein